MNDCNAIEDFSLFTIMRIAPENPSNDYSVYALIGIIIAGAIAVYIFMKRR